MQESCGYFSSDFLEATSTLNDLKQLLRIHAPLFEFVELRNDEYVSIHGTFVPEEKFSLRNSTSAVLSYRRLQISGTVFRASSLGH
uniref:FTH domain-containing protein n=1 Tax=Ascaris lumbricoides TaxID=6252 RepID=A0A0M3HWP2_ASCLU